MNTDVHYMIDEAVIWDIAKILCSRTANEGACDSCGFHKDKNCSQYKDGCAMYAAGYRLTAQPLRGTWILDQDEDKIFKCSNCNTRNYWAEQHCPTCKAKMKASDW